MSAIIGASFNAINPPGLDISLFSLELPTNIKTNINEDLLPYLNAIQMSGYETNKTRKVFAMGNTGM